MNSAISTFNIRPSERQSALTEIRNLKMARSAHAYVRGSTIKFYEWLDSSAKATIAEGPAVWICGDCHVGNLGPIANKNGKVDIQIRDFDQTVIGNPAHDLIRLALSLSMAARSSDLPGVTTAKMMEELTLGYAEAFRSENDDPNATLEKPQAVQLVLKEALRRTWRDLASERLELNPLALPLGKRFWKTSKSEFREIQTLVKSDLIRDLVTRLKQRESDAQVDLLDAAYWMKGCSSLGLLRYAAVLDVGKTASRGADLCLIDFKEATKAIAPRRIDARMPRDNAKRVAEGALHLSPYIGKRITATSLMGRSVFVRELLPQDLKLEIAQVTQAQAIKAAGYLAAVVGRAHARQMDEPTKRSWRAELTRRRSRALNTPSWLWSSVVELVGIHERAYLEHCRLRAFV